MAIDCNIGSTKKKENHVIFMFILTQIPLYCFPFPLKTSIKGITCMLNNQDFWHMSIKATLSVFLSPFKSAKGSSSSVPG